MDVIGAALEFWIRKSAAPNSRLCMGLWGGRRTRTKKNLEIAVDYISQRLNESIPNFELIFMR
jgi:hypothetical protein